MPRREDPHVSGAALRLEEHRRRLVTESRFVNPGVERAGERLLVVCRQAVECRKETLLHRLGGLSEESAPGTSERDGSTATIARRSVAHHELAGREARHDFRDG